MIHKVFKATCEQLIKNDFVKTCQKYLETLQIKMTFEDIKQMSEFRFKKMVKQKTTFSFQISDVTKEQDRKKHKNQKHKIQTVVYSRVFAGRKLKILNCLK